VLALYFLSLMPYFFIEHDLSDFTYIPLAVGCIQLKSDVFTAFKDYFILLD
jgi:hypothetical protein